MPHKRYAVPFVAMVALLVGPQLVQSDQAYCATINTAAIAKNSSIYQSNGLCHDYCIEKQQAFAIVQYKDCWCSDYIPPSSGQVDAGECSMPCPGWKYETCGGTGVFGYIQLDVMPSGTAGGDSTSTSATSSTSTTSTSSSDQETDTPTHPTTTAPTRTPTTSVKTVTAGGTVSLETVTVIPTLGPGSGNSNSGQHLTAGATAGIVIGVIAVTAILAGAGVFLYLQRKKREREEELASRPDSQFSGSAGGVMSTPTTTMASIWDGENTSTGRRSSRLMPHDPRMDPFATNIYGRFENKSRESINTLQDNQDYSRKVLRTTNPDPED